jgi:hypothetical protein
MLKCSSHAISGLELLSEQVSSSCFNSWVCRSTRQNLRSAGNSLPDGLKRACCKALLKAMVFAKCVVRLFVIVVCCGAALNELLPADHEKLKIDKNTKIRGNHSVSLFLRFTLLQFFIYLIKIRQIKIAFTGVTDFVYLY